MRIADSRTSTKAGRNGRKVPLKKCPFPPKKNIWTLYHYGIGATIHIAREIQCLLYVGFKKIKFNNYFFILFFFKYFLDVRWWERLQLGQRGGGGGPLPPAYPQRGLFLLQGEVEGVHQEPEQRGAVFHRGGQKPRPLLLHKQAGGQLPRRPGGDFPQAGRLLSGT